MSDWDNYKGIFVPSATPTGEAGLHLKEGLKTLADWRPQSVWGETADPTPNDDVTQGFHPGSFWLNVATPAMFVCVDNTEEAATWVNVQSGGGAAQTLAVFSPLNNLPPSSDSARFDVRGGVPVLAFDKTDNQSAIFLSVAPGAYAGENLKVKLTWAAALTSGDVVWNAQFRRLQAGTDNLDSGSFAGVQTAVTAVAGTAGVLIETQIPFTAAQAASINAGDNFLLKITRDADDEDDTLDDDADLLSVKVLAE